MASERIFNPIGRRHQRRRYSEREWRVGLVLLVGLALVVGWVARRGARPEPALLPLPDSLHARAAAPVEVFRRPLVSWLDGEGFPAGADPTARAGATSLSPWAPFPASVAGEEWAATGPVEAYGPDNVYVKIDGRDEFYLGFGLRSLHCLSLAGPDGASLDLELFTLGSPDDAAGALLAEVSDPAARVAVSGGALRYATANAGFLARGDRYLRAIGADRGEATRRGVAAALDAVVAALPAAALPWAFDLFGSRLGVEPRRISYHGEDAFGFAFAREVYAAAPAGSDGEWFVVRAGDGAACAELAARFLAGFGSYGEPVAPLALAGGLEVPAVRDRWLGAVSAVVAAPPWVAGVRRARDRDEAGDLLARLVGTLAAPVVAAPAPAAPGAPAGSPAPDEEEELGAPRGGAGGRP